MTARRDFAGQLGPLGQLGRAGLPWARRIGLAWLFWTLVALLFALPRLSFGEHGRDTLLGSLAQWWSWGVFAPLVLSIDRRLPFGRRQAGRRIAAHALAGMLVTAWFVVLYALLRTLLGLEPWSRLSGASLVADAREGLYLWSFLVYCLIAGVAQASRSHREYLSAELRMVRLERAFTEARLHALRSQLDPHFLFNALNTISSQLEREPKLARAMIEHLGDLLRASLASHSRPEITLAEELALLDHYLAIQRIRFGASLRVDFHIAPGARDAAVPNLFLQPLVENAIRHGIAPRAGGGHIVVGASVDGARLVVTVTDDGVGLPPGWSDAVPGGVGLSVTRERLATLHGDAGRFALARRAGGGTALTLSFPYRCLETR